MLLDLIAGTALTASAAVVVATLAVTLAETGGGRFRLAAALSAWFAAVAAIAATQLLAAERGPLALAGLGLAVAGPIVTLTIVGACSASLRARLAQAPLPTLIGVHAVRVLGVLFVALYLQHRLPAPFAPSAGWGDVFIGVTALPLAWLVAWQGAAARPLVVLWNALGIADLVAAIGLGMTSSPGPLQLFVGDVNSSLMTTLPWLLIPGYLVPLLFVTHLAIAWRLRAEGGGRATIGVAAPAAR